jgi:hypothetical protein
MKLSDITEEFEGINEAPPGGWLNTKALIGKADKIARDNPIGRFADKLNKAVSQKYGGAHGNKTPTDIDGGVDDKETDDWIKSGAKDAPKAKAQKVAPPPQPKAVAPQQIKSADNLKPGSLYQDGDKTWTWNGINWTDGKTELDPAKGLKGFNKALTKGQAIAKEDINPYFNPSLDEAPPGVGMIKKAAGAVKQGIGKVAQKGADMAVGAVANATGASKDDVKAAAQQQGGIAGKVAGMASGGAEQPDPKQAQQVAQKATQLRSVTGGKASGSMVAKGLDKVAQGQTLPPNIIKAISPYAQSIQTIMTDPQLMMKFKQLMKQANKGQGQQ